LTRLVRRGSRRHAMAATGRHCFIRQKHKALAVIAVAGPHWRRPAIPDPPANSNSRATGK